MKVKELINQLSKLNPELEVFVETENNDFGFNIKKVSEISEYYLILADHIADGGHIYDESDFNEHIEEDDSFNTDDYDFVGKAVVISD